MRHALALAVLAALCLALSALPAGRAVEARVSRPLLFAARAALGRAPGVDPRLRIFAYDDAAAAQLKKESLGPSDWAAVLARVGAAAPAAVYADELFAFGPQAPDGVLAAVSAA